MCVDCVKEEYPERDNICLDTGTYLLNFVGCSQCKRHDGLVVENKKLNDDDEEEVTTYDHVCKECQHLVASHLHIFKVDDDYQEYEMNCLLCGVGEDSKSIMPYDPRKHNLVY